VPPKFDKRDFQSPTIGELRATGIGTKTCPGKLDLLVYCQLTGRCPHCKSALISANSVGKRKLCYAIPWPKTIVGVDMRCSKCNKHFMTHDVSYVDTLPSKEQIKQEFVTA
jgi:phage FluMu protein Com